MQLISLFSGIGGFELAGEKAGWDIISTCEIENFPHNVLKYYWPDAYHHRDVKTLTYETLRKKSRWNPNEPTILTGGFPCQPFSMAGARRGTEDDRYLWPEMFRIIKDIRPDWIIPENVAGITTMALPSSPVEMGSQGGLFEESDTIYELRENFVLNEIIEDIESEGYTVAPLVIPAEAVGAPHRRDRIWIVANASSNRRKRSGQKTEAEKGQQQRPEQAGELSGRPERFCNDRNATNPSDQRLQGSQWDQSHEQRNREETFRPTTQRFKIQSWSNWPTQPPICSGDDGLSTRLDRITFPKWRQESIKGYGNAIVPQVAMELFNAIKEYYK